VHAERDAGERRQHDSEHERDGDRGERAASDQHPGRHGRRPPALENARLALAGDRDDQRGERRGDDAERDHAGDVERRAVEVDAVLAHRVVPEHAHEQDEEDHGQRHRGHARLPVAHEAAQVVAELVLDEMGGRHRCSSAVSSR
jgi:hypothetical protein